MRRLVRTLAALAFSMTARLGGAQTVPPMRPIGRVIRVSAAGLLGSVSSVRTLPGGRLIINDLTRHRVVLLDSTLTTATVVGDSSERADGVFGPQFVGIIPYRGDSTLYVDPKSLSALVLDGAGKVTRVMAIPRPQDAPYLVGGPFGTPRFDPLGRLVHRGAARRPLSVTTSSDGANLQLPSQPDSAPVVRTSFLTRKEEILGAVRVWKIDIKVTERPDGGRAITTTFNPMQTLDDWAVLSDGTLALVRGVDYHLDWVRPDGSHHSSSRIPFEWKRLTRSEREAFLDSTRAAIDGRIAAARAQTDSGEGQAHRIAEGTAPSRRPAMDLVTADELPDYRPAFEPGATRADFEDRLWIRTSHFVNNGAVYDVLNRDGELVDRVLVPPFRTIIGFGGRDLIYMAVLDGRSARLEVARPR